MKPITAIITEADIRFHIEETATELEEDNQIHFHDSESRAEFIEDCIACEIDKYELYDRDPFGYYPDYSGIVLDTAKLYGYLL